MTPSCEGADAAVPDDTQIEQSIQFVRDITWNDWRAAFEHIGPIQENPILANPECFHSFCWGWKVGRTIRAGKHEGLRCFLLKSEPFAHAVNHDDSGAELARLAERLRKRFGAVNTKTRHAASLISAVSKIAAFLRPDRFVAWDQYARRGLNMVCGRKGDKFPSYDGYLADFDAAWKGPIGRRICEMTKQDAIHPIKRKIGFQRRVLDLYLMAKGGAGFKRQEKRPGCRTHEILSSTDRTPA